MAQILVVDDDEGVRSFIAETLERHSHEVTAVGSGEEAFLQLRKHNRLHRLPVPLCLLSMKAFLSGYILYKMILQNFDR